MLFRSLRQMGPVSLHVSVSLRQMGMQMTCHDAPCMYFKVFVLLAVPDRCQYNVFVIGSYKQIYPVGNCKSYKIQLTVISEFIFSAHDIKSTEIFRMLMHVCRIAGTDTPSLLLAQICSMALYASVSVPIAGS